MAEEKKKTTTVITFGTFDLLHVGHVRILQRAAALGDRLVVGVSSDTLNFSKKKKHAQFPYAERKEIVEAIRGVDEVFCEESLALKAEYVKQFGADILVMGDDWKGAFDGLAPKVVYLARTEGVSSTDIISGVVARDPTDQRQAVAEAEAAAAAAAAAGAAAADK